MKSITLALLVSVPAICAAQGPADVAAPSQPPPVPVTAPSVETPAAAPAIASANVEASPVDDGTVAVIVHPSNTLESLPEERIRLMFLRRQGSWEGGGKGVDGETVVPIDLPPASLARQRFSEKCLDASVHDIEAFWNAQRIKGDSRKPQIKTSAASVLLLVSQVPRAIGYVPKSLAAKTPGVKIIAEF